MQAANLAPQLVRPESLKLHPRAALVPEMPPDQYPAFLADVKLRGVQKAIERIPGTDTVIDGRTRLRAAKEAGLPLVPVVDAELNGDTPEMYMMRTALLRRHLTTGQAAALAVEIEGELAKVAKQRQREGGKKGGSTKGKGVAPAPQPSTTPAPKSRDVAAAMVGISGRTVSDAKQVAKNSPDLFEKMKAGTVTLAEAKRAGNIVRPTITLPAVKPASNGKPATAELLPCPFCGSTSVRVQASGLYVYCPDCMTCGPSPSDPTPKNSAKAWNKRATK